MSSTYLAIVKKPSGDTHRRWGIHLNTDSYQKPSISHIHKVSALPEVNDEDGMRKNLQWI